MATNTPTRPAGVECGRPERLRESTPSAKLTYLVVERAAPRALTVAELRDRTRLSDRTLRRAISDLDDADLIERRWRLPGEHGLEREIGLVEPEA